MMLQYNYPKICRRYRFALAGSIYHYRHLLASWNLCTITLYRNTKRGRFNLP